MQRGAKGHLTIVTFNYDRSLDYYLSTSFRHSNGWTPDEARAHLSQLNIIHVHGILCALPSGAESQRPRREYGFDGLTRSVRLAAGEIKIIHEGSDASPEYQCARAALYEAQRVCFIGFGYHPTNVKRLLDGGWLSRLERSKVVGSAFGFTESEKSTVRELFVGKITLGEQNHECLRFLRENSSIIS